MAPRIVSIEVRRRRVGCVKYSIFPPSSPSLSALFNPSYVTLSVCCAGSRCPPVRSQLPTPDVALHPWSLIESLRCDHGEVGAAFSVLCVLRCSPQA